MAEDAIYISLNFEDPELKRVMPWTGTSSGPEAFIRSPFSIHAKVKDGKIAFFQFMEDTFATARSFKIAFFQFMEDTFATARSFRSNGALAIQTQPNGPTFEVTSARPHRVKAHRALRERLEGVRPALPAG
jgi:hypothetical protein